MRFETRFPKEETRTRKFRPRAALPFPKTAAKKSAATPVPDVRISCLGTGREFSYCCRGERPDSERVLTCGEVCNVAQNIENCHNSE